MGQSFVISGLVEKRAELAGILADLERKATQCRSDLVHLDAALRLFAPEYEPDAIKPKQVIPPRSLYFQMGVISDRCREALRKADGQSLSAQDIAVAAMQDKRLDVLDSKMRADFIRRILWALNRMAKRGQVTRIGAGRNVRWKLPEPTVTNN
jgi:hypothetical protein